MAEHPPRQPVDPALHLPVDPPPVPLPMLTRASVTFHTNDDDKDADTRVDIVVGLDERLVVARISDMFGHFADHTDSGPYTLLLEHPVNREQLKRGIVDLRM